MTRYRSIGLLLIALLLVPSGEAGAHAVLLETSPADDAVLARAPDAVRLRFSEPVRPITVRVLDVGRNVELELAALEATNGEVRVAFGQPLADGTYVVSWRVSSLDLHPVSGAFVFDVGAGAGRRPQAAPPSAHDAAWQVAAAAARALWYGVLLIAAGLALFPVLIRAPQELRPALRRPLSLLAPVGVVTGMLALGISGGALQGEGASTLLTPGPWLLAAGTPLAASVVVAGLGLMLLAIAARRDRRDPLLAGAILIALSFACSGHAMTAEPRWLAMPAFALHALLAAFWLGAFWALLVAVGRCPPGQAGALLSAFSRVALPAVALLVLAGTVLALVELKSPSDLVATGYGQRLALKLALVACLLGLAALNRWMLTPALLAGRADAARWLRRTLRLDLLLAAAVVGMTASLGAVPPPRSFASGEAHPAAHHHGARAYTTRVEIPQARLVLVASPARTGPNRIDLRFMDPAGQPLGALAAELRLSLPDQGVEALRVEAGRQGIGHFVAPAASLPLAGVWHVQADLLVDDFTELTFRTRIEVSP
jgi:copper transport protein